MVERRPDCEMWCRYSANFIYPCAPPNPTETLASPITPACDPPDVVTFPLHLETSGSSALRAMVLPRIWFADPLQHWNITNKCSILLSYCPLVEQPSASEVGGFEARQASCWHSVFKGYKHLRTLSRTYCTTTFWKASSFTVADCRQSVM